MLTLTLTFLLNILPILSIRYYVDPSLSSSGGSGQSWSDAFNSLSIALLTARIIGDEIWLKHGIYYPQLSSTTSRDNCFVSRPGISIYGGFDGNENVLSDRRTNINNRPQSIISGDIGILNDKSDNCYHVLTYTQSLNLDCIIIQDGNANYIGSYDYNNQQINVLNRYGGALITSDSFKTTNLYLENVIIRNNSAILGGALFVQSNDINNVDVVIKNSIFEYNQAINGEYEGGYGGAIYSMFLSNVTIFNTEFNHNHADLRGGAIYQDYGALLYVDNCQFIDNNADMFGGAIFSEDRNSQTIGTFPTVINSLFRSNQAGDTGGAIFLYNGVEAILTNNQFSNNQADVGGAIAKVINTITTSTSNSFNGNTANNDSSTNDEYIETASDILYTSVDPSLSFDITQELSLLYNRWNTMLLSESDLYPFDDNNRLCYVDIDNSNSNQNGNTWNTAYNDLQSCLDALSTIINGGEIWVKSGVYIPTSIPEWKQKVNKNGNIHLSFEMYDNIRMYGGFDGTEISRDQRNWSSNPTYLSCQYNSRVQCNQIINSADNTLIDGFIFINAGNGVLRRRRLANSLSVDQILSSTASNPGSGIYSNSTSVNVVNSIFYKLFSSGKGGAVYCIGQQGDESNNIIKSPYFLNVAFLGNRAAVRGGGIAADVQCNFKCKYCKFDSNQCSLKGGAIYLDFDSIIELEDVVFKNNVALESGGGIALDGKSFVTFNGTNNSFIGNSAKMAGGALYSGSGVGINIKQGFYFATSTIPLFSNNFISNIAPNSIESDIYGWPFTTIDIPALSALTTSRPTLSPTPAPVTNVKPDIQPNILIFTIDDILFTSYWSESAPQGTNLENGKVIEYFDFETPNIEAFRQEAVIFPQSYAAGPKCAPSRFAVLTGRQTTRSEWAIDRTMKTSSGQQGVNVTIQTSKIYYNDSHLNIAFVLQNDANTPYYTGQVGKWHLMTSGDNGNYYGCSALDDIQDSILYSQCIDIVKQQGFDYVNAWYYSNIGDNNYFSHNPEWMVSQSQKIIETAQAQNKPFFLYFAATLTHDPSIETALNDFTFQDSPKGTLTGDDNPSDTLMSSRLSIWQKALSHQATNTQRQEYYASHYWIDDQFGALINYLKINDLYDNTFIVLINDHGMGTKGVLYQQGSRIIHFVRYPPLFGDNGPYIMPRDFVVSNVDLAAVIFEITSITPPANYIIDGISWVQDVIKEIQSPSTQTQSTQTQTCCQYRYLDIFNSHSIVSDSFQYIYRANPNLVETDNAVDTFYPNMYDQEQLYDLNKDPNQKTNEINNAAYSSVITTFQSLMRDYLKDICPLNDKSLCITPDFTFGTLPPTMPTMTPSISSTKIPTKSPSLSPTILETSIDDKAKDDQTQDDQIHDNQTSYIIYIVIVILLCLCCVISVYMIKKWRDKKQEEDRKLKAAKTAITITSSDGVEMGDNRNVRPKHIAAVPSSSALSVEFTETGTPIDGFDDHETQRLKMDRLKGGHLALPSTDLSFAIQDTETMAQNFAE